MHSSLTTQALSNTMYMAYPSCLPTVKNLTMGSTPFASLAAAAALKCSTNLPTRSNLRVAPNCFLVASNGVMADCGLLVRYRYHA